MSATPEYFTPSNPPVFPENVPILKTSDPVLGGVGGKANAQAEVLQEQTNWLRKFYLDVASSVVALWAALNAALGRVTALENVVQPAAGALGDIDDASRLTRGTLNLLRLPRAIINSMTVQRDGTGTIQYLVIEPQMTTFQIDFAKGGIIEIQLQNAQPCNLSFINQEQGQTGELYFKSLLNTPRAVILPGGAPECLVAFPYTRTLTVRQNPCAIAYRVFSPTLMYCTFIPEFRNQQQ